MLHGVSSGNALVTGVLASIASVSWAAAQDDFFPIAIGAALGVVGLGWAIYRAANDQRFETILKRLDKSEAEVDDCLGKLKLANDKIVATDLRLSEVTGNYELLKKRLAMHVCPVPADPGKKCNLPDIINITL